MLGILLLGALLSTILTDEGELDANEELLVGHQIEQQVPEGYTELQSNSETKDSSLANDTPKQTFK